MIGEVCLAPLITSFPYGFARNPPPPPPPSPHEIKTHLLRRKYVLFVGEVRKKSTFPTCSKVNSYFPTTAMENNVLFDQIRFAKHDLQTLLTLRIGLIVVVATTAIATEGLIDSFI